LEHEKAFLLSNCTPISVRPKRNKKGKTEDGSTSTWALVRKESLSPARELELTAMYRVRAEVGGAGYGEGQWENFLVCH
jgi:hypothetical protein